MDGARRDLAITQRCDGLDAFTSGCAEPLAFAFGPHFRLYTIMTLLLILSLGAWTGTYAARLNADLATPWLGVVERVCLIVVLGALHPDYSQSQNFISELGAPDAPYADVMNLIGIALVGLLLVVFSVALWRSQPWGSLGIAGSLLLAVSGIAFVAVGLLPCDQAGCSPEAPSAVMRWHVVAGVTAMTAQTLAAVAYGLRLFSGAGARWYARSSLALGLVALFSLTLLVGSGLRLPAPGVAQKAMQLSADTWVFVSAVHVLRAGRARTSGSARAR